MEDKTVLRGKSKKLRVLMTIAAIIMALIIISGPGCGNQWILFYDKPIKGYVIDAETKEPIEGAIVVSMWRLSQFLSEGFGGYAKIIVKTSDKEGKFEIPFWIAFKPWRFNSAMHDLAPEFVIYKPGYRVYRSHELEREGFPEDKTVPADEKRATREAYSLSPAKLKKVYTDDEIWENHKEFRSQANFPDTSYSKQQLKELFDVLQSNALKLPDNIGSGKEKLLKDIKEDREFYLGGKK
ncbi:MAG: hypothetical protein ACM339_05315 [Ignavibacteria bacterium]